MEMGKIPGVEKILAELKAERQQMEEAIVSLERLALGRGKRRGRPPSWMLDPGLPKRRGRPPVSKNRAPTDDPDPLPPAASMGIPRRRYGLVWAVSGRKRPPS